MSTLKVPSKPGTAFGGGYYAGRFFIDDQAYALIVSPKATGQIDQMPWSKSINKVAGANSYCDGLNNTTAMVKAGSALAKKITDLQIGKLKDWYLPSRLELLIAHHCLAAVKAFKPGGKEAFDLMWYWSSTQHASDAGYAWYQFFGDGYQGLWRKDDDGRARAVRRIKITI